MTVLPQNEKSQSPDHRELESETESSDLLESESDIEEERVEQRNEKADLPPPYTP